MMKRPPRKRMAPEAAATAPRAGFVASGKSTLLHTNSWTDNTAAKQAAEAEWGA